MSPATLLRWAVAIVAGGLLCTAGDHLHVTNGVLFYPHPDIWGQAWWVFPLMAGATWSGLIAARRVHPAHSPPLPVPKLRLTPIRNLVAFALCYAWTAIHPTTLGISAALIALFAVETAFYLPPRRLLFCVIVAIAGTSWEIMWSRIGMFTYVHPGFLGVPVWLPLLYLHAGLAADSARRVLDGADAATSRNPENPP